MNKSLMRGCCTGALIVLSQVLLAHAGPILYSFNGIGTGTFGGLGFTNATFTISVFADTTNVQVSADLDTVEETASAIGVTGLGLGIFNNPKQVFRHWAYLGLSQFNGNDLLDLSDYSFSGYNLLNSFGPTPQFGPQPGPMAINELTTFGLISFASLNNISFVASTGNPAPPQILAQPTNQTVLAGAYASISLQVASAAPIAFYWQRAGTNLPGSQDPLVLTNVQTENAGEYFVVVTNMFGSVTSQVVTLTVTPSPPILTLQPLSQALLTGAAARFTSSADGTSPLGWQWFFNGSQVTAGNDSQLVINNVQSTNFGNYWVVVTNMYGSATSEVATLSFSPILVWGSFYYAPSLTNVPPSATNVIAMAAGDTHCLALKADGTVVAWGVGAVGQTNVPPNLTNVVSIAAGSTHSLALRSDGTLAAWGAIFNSSAMISVPPTATNIAAMALGPGAQHAFILRTDGTVLDWGNNNNGLTNIPVMARNIIAVASGATYCLALRADGRLVQWGSDLTSIPNAATNIVAIATGWYGSAGLRSDGTVLAWGSTYVPPLTGMTNVLDLVCPLSGISGSDILALRRNGTLAEYSSSVPAYPTNSITAVAAGGFNAFAVVGSGPPVFPGLPINHTVASGSRAYLRMLAAGSMPIGYQWTCTGTNLPGATNSVLVLTNVQPALAGSIYSLIASNSFGMATSGPVLFSETPSEAYIQTSASAAVVNQMVTFTGSTIGQGPFVYQWQFNGTNLQAATNLVLTLTNAQLSAAGSYSFIVSNRFGAATNDVVLTVAPTIITNPLQNQITFLGGTATFDLGLQAVIPITYQWQFNGVNLDGATNNSLNLANAQNSLAGTYSLIFSDAFETSTNSATLAVVPVAAWGYIGQQSLPPLLTNVIAIANGDYYQLALEANGTVIGWGQNAYGAMVAPPGLSNVIAIAAGSFDSLALQNDGGIVAWGINNFGQTNVPPGLTNVVAIASGFECNLVLKSDGTVVAWGNNAFGQTNVPANLTNVVAIAAGVTCSMALRADGTVFAWGAITSVPLSATNVVQIAAGWDDDLVLRADGSIIGWGSNDSGQDNMPSGLSNVVAIAIGYSQSAALKTDGTVMAWGANQYGQSTVPTGLTNVIALLGRNYQNLALIGSSPPTLQVTVSNCTWTTSGFQFSVPSLSGRVYALEHKASLTDSNWTTLPLAAGNGGMLRLTDPTATQAQRFYRVRRW